MSMFCYQCQEAAGNEGCTVKGVCGKEPETANLQDLLIWLLKGISYYGEKAKEEGITDEETNVFVTESLFSTITNANFDDDWFKHRISRALEVRDSIRKKYESANGEVDDGELPEAATWMSHRAEDYYEKAKEVGVKATEDRNIRSLRELLTYGIKGIAAYADHAYVLNEKKQEIFDFIQKGLAATLDDSLGVDDLVNLVVEAGNIAVETMETLDKANTGAYGDPEPTEVNLGVRGNPGILISGHDLRDMEELLEQTEGEGVDVYTHGEMLPANAYPAFKEYDHFVGNYGNSWWKQNEEFEKFNGPILMTTNCIVPPEDSYKERVYTTGVVSFPELPHIEDRTNGGQKDFWEIIDHAKDTEPPKELETGSIPGGFAHDAVLSRADDIIEGIESGDIRGFVVMGGCDGRHASRDYYKDVARELPDDTIILTAGCAKFRYNKLDLGTINGIPRILDAGQCNDSYSLIKIAKELAEATGVDDLNELPISYDIAWYEQKAVTVLLALLSQGVEGIRLGPTLPAFVSEDVLDVLVDKFNLKPIGSVENDVEAILEELQ
ncbi:MAG: hydroxylamine reductase [Candidatus Bipolaricaulota bacterium]|nr:hydroxylamine reductase [Candidatus Bipolaricaulota bacterium]MBS3792261.1 hydroxylamine reductase [Candidatus Bipolaricaulota bacterium]